MMKLFDTIFFSPKTVVITCNDNISSYDNITDKTPSRRFPYRTQKEIKRSSELPNETYPFINLFAHLY